MFIGNFVAIVTPMYEDGEVDYSALKTLVEWHIEKGSQGLVVCGTTGEASALSEKEYFQVVEKVANTVNGRIPVVVGTGATSTNKCLELIKLIEPLKVNGLLCVTPYYVKPSQEGMKAHFEKIASYTELPIILYNVPARTGVDLSAESVIELSKIPNIVSIKEATGNLDKAKIIIDNTDEKFTLLSGDDATFLSAMQLGAKGVVSVTSNIFPEQMSQICDWALEAKFEEAGVLNEKIANFHELLFTEPSPTPTKWVLFHMGMIQQGIRLPLLLLSDQQKTVIINSLRQLEFDLTSQIK
ncbi:MAG: 4-hydroxy-tetrahydrodipicolinate synthase [Pseudomonadota bacterium]